VIVHACRGFVLLAFASAAAAQAALEPAADQAQGIQGLWHLMLWICGFMYLLVMLFLAGALWRKRQTLQAALPDAHGHHGAEMPLRHALSGWVVLITVGLFILTGGSFLLDRQLAQARMEDALHVRITAAQWWWKIEYDDPVPAHRITTANELYLPVDRPVYLELRADDVIHSLWIPNLAGKKDLIPGRTTDLLFTPLHEGRFRGQCAEFCGLQHAKMAIDAVVVSAPAFDQWRDHQRSAAPAPASPQQQRGLQLIEQGPCAACHQVHGTQASGQSGPNLTHLASRRTLAAGARPYSTQALREWLRDPQRIKPGNHMPQVQLSSEDVDAVVAYLDTLE
jgi:cytochrome c oxidase subunit II